MFKSIFVKLLTSFGLIVLMSFLLLVSIITSVVNSYSLSQNAESVKWTASTVKAVIEEGIEITGEDTLDEFIAHHGQSMENVSSAIFLRNTKITVFITDTEGNVLKQINKENTGVAPAQIRGDIISSAIGDGEYSGVTDLRNAHKTNYVLYGSVIKDSRGELLGISFACMEYGANNALMNLLSQTVLMSSLWVALAALIAVYFISERMTSPLKNMCNVSKKLAKGAFEERVAVTGRDEIAELSIAFNNMADSLEHLENTRNTFIANVSHDLRTPMTTILGFIEGINSGAIPEEKHEYYLNVISSEIKRLSRLVTELLDISRLEAGTRKFTPTRFDICEMARLILISFEQKIEEKHLDVGFECTDDNMFVYADKDAVHQALYNLCDNAIKFSIAGGKFAISITRKEHKKIFVSVYNEGTGIPEKDLPYVFDRFYKTDESRGMDKSGVGLGLYITKTVIDSLDEAIFVKSEEGKYCEFVFTLTEKA